MDATISGSWVNGFLRHVQGTAPSDQGLVVLVTTDKNLVIRFANDLATECTFVVTPNAYGSGAERVPVAAGRERALRWQLSRKHRWYDFTVTCDARPGFARRFAGRAENGRPGVSDPAMGT